MTRFLSKYALAIIIACICLTATAQTDEGDTVSNIDRARACCRLDKPEEALYYYLAAQNSLDRQTDEGIIASADIDTEIGLLYFNRGHYERAAANFDKALKVYNTYNQADKIRQNTNFIAASAYLAEDYPKAETYFKSLLDCCRKDNDRASEKETMRRLADIAQKMGEYDKALKINSDLVELYSEDGDTQGYINTLNNAAYCLVLCGRYEDGINAFREITDEDIRNNAHDSLIAAAYTNIGLCYQNMGKSSECYEYLVKAADLRKNCGQDAEYSKVCNILSLIYLKEFAVAADCTGHGVPGAFMSMLGVSLLTKIITERKVFAADKILNSLREEVKKSLNYDRKEGLDLSLIKINMKTLMMEFAAANNNGFLLRNYPKSEKELAEQDMAPKDVVTETPDGYLRVKTLEADKMPIGAFFTTNDMPMFSLHTIQLQHGDTIYLTSDGFLDQFGGKHGKRFMTSNFTKLLTQINTLPMSEQYDKMIATNEKWRGEKYQQIDDIIVFGLRIL